MKLSWLLPLAIISSAAFASPVTVERINELEAQIKAQNGVVGSCTDVSLSATPTPLTGEDFEAVVVVLNMTLKDGTHYKMPEVYPMNSTIVNSSNAVAKEKSNDIILKEKVKIKKIGFNAYVHQFGKPGSEMVFLKENKEIKNIMTGWLTTERLWVGYGLLCSK